MDISDKTSIALKIRSAGSYRGYELVLRHNGESGDAVPSYVIYFEVSPTLATKSIVAMKLFLGSRKRFRRSSITDRGFPSLSARSTDIERPTSESKKRNFDWYIGLRWTA